MGSPEWLPVGVRRAQEAADRAEARAAAVAESQRAAVVEEARQRSLVAAREAAQLRGEAISAMATVTGEGLGREVGDVFGDALAAAAADDVVSAARASRFGQTTTHIDFGPAVVHPSSPSAPSSRGAALRMELARRSRRFNAWVEAKQSAEDARNALERSRDEGLVAAPVPRRDPVIDATSGTRSRSAFPPQCSRARYEQRGYCGCLACPDFDVEDRSRAGSYDVRIRNNGGEIVGVW
jgi:hypothetical protein